MIKFKPGLTFRKDNKHCQPGISHLVVLLSSDKEFSFDSDTPVWRCASFQAMKDGSLLGAQIVLCAESELKDMVYDGGLRLADLKKYHCAKHGWNLTACGLPLSECFVGTGIVEMKDLIVTNYKWHVSCQFCIESMKRNNIEYDD